MTQKTVLRSVRMEKQVGNFCYFHKAEMWLETDGSSYWLRGILEAVSYVNGRGSAVKYLKRLETSSAIFKSETHALGVFDKNVESLTAHGFVPS